jgi:hypothetical protein
MGRAITRPPKRLPEKTQSVIANTRTKAKTDEVDGHYLDETRAIITEKGEDVLESTPPRVFDPSIMNLEMPCYPPKNY